MPSCLRAALAMFLPAVLLMSATAFAQAPAPGLAPPPPPPKGAPLPPGGPSVILDHNGFVHVDVHCAPAETTRACIELATQLYDKLNGSVQAK